MAIVAEATFNWNGLVFDQYSNGHLACKECKSDIWCNHIARLVKDNGDSEILFKDFSDDITYIEVPMFPTKNLWQRMILAPSDGRNAFRVLFSQHDNQEPYSLGFLNPGEGRNVMRSMMIDWFNGMVELSTLQCRSSSHGMKAQVLWESAVRPLNLERFPNYFCVWRHNSCIYCYNRGNEDFRDLIPDAGTGQKKPWEK